MNSPTLNTHVKFIVEVKHVREVALVVDADIAFWQERLRGEALLPYHQNGKAELILTATEIQWMGTRTNELTIGIPVCEREETSTPDGLYLVHAFNSSRLFAWIERRFFHTPYYPARIRVEDRVPVRIQLSDAHGVIIDAQMTGKPAPASSGDELWQGAIFLPRDKTHPHNPGRFFVAKLEGYTETYPYSPLLSSVRLTQRTEHPVFGWLLESNLVGREWRIRSDATHARSKTFTRA